MIVQQASDICYVLLAAMERDGEGQTKAKQERQKEKALKMTQLSAVAAKWGWCFTTARPQSPSRKHQASLRLAGDIFIPLEKY